MTAPGAAALALLLALFAACESAYLGAEVGALSTLHHGVRGQVFAVDSRTLYLHDFHYDGEGPAAYFYVGTSKAVGAAGAVRVRDERGGAGPLRRYRGEGLTLTLPDGHTLRDVHWFAVWCDEYAVNFGDVSIPRELEYPRSVKVGSLRGIHGVSSDAVVVVDAQTLLVPNFSYDGEAPDAKFWVGRGDKPSAQGIRIPDEHGTEAPLRKYDRKTIVLTLPGELTVFDIGHLAVWCEAFTVNFGHVTLPAAQLAHVPPSLKMLGVSPQNRNKELEKDSPPPPRGRRPSPRRPLARLDATTYRPQLRPGTFPLAATADSSPHTSLHRRADDYTSPAAQLVDQEKDIQKYKKQAPEQDTRSQKYDEKSELPQQPQVQIVAQNRYEQPIERNHEAQSVTQNHEPAHNQTPIGSNQQPLSISQNDRLKPRNEYYQQEKSQEIYQEHYQEPFYEYLNPYQQPAPQPQVLLPRGFEHSAFQLLNHRQYQPLVEHLQYRLVPYHTGSYGR